MPWVLMDGDTVAGVIVYDGVTEYSPPEGLKLVRIDEPPAGLGPEWKQVDKTQTWTAPVAMQKG